jgi:hypothetical protein
VLASRLAQPCSVVGTTRRSDGPTCTQRLQLALPTAAPFLCFAALAALFHLEDHVPNDYSNKVRDRS